MVHYEINLYHNPISRSKMNTFMNTNGAFEAFLNACIHKVRVHNGMLGYTKCNFNDISKWSREHIPELGALCVYKDCA